MITAIDNKLIRATDVVVGDEKVWGYQEIHLQSPDSEGFHRYRRILVNRNGELAEYCEDMGLAKNFRGKKQFNIPSLWEHTVDELRDLADYLRNETYIDVKDWLKLDRMKLA